MAKIKIVIKDLEQALKTGEFTNFYERIQRDPKCLKQRFGDIGKTLLHFMCAINIDEIKQKQSLTQLDQDDESSSNSEDVEVIKVESDQYREVIETLIDDYALDVNMRDMMGNTPLHYAVMANNESVVDLLLEYEAVDVDNTNRDGVSALNIASTYNYVGLEKKLLAESEQFNEEVIPVGETVKEVQRREKYKIMAIGAIRKLESGTIPSTVEAIESVTYFEDTELKNNFNLLLQDANKSEVLSNMIKMMAVCSVRGTIPEIRRLTLFRQHAELLSRNKNAEPEELVIYEMTLLAIENELGKRFKIICVDAEDTSSLKMFAAEPRGLYTNKNSIFVATKSLSENEVFATIMHESAHFVILQLFQNSAKPYPNDAIGNILRDKYQNVVANTKESMVSIEHGLSNELEETAFKIIENVYIAYTNEKWDEELIVRVPQILGLMGAGKGDAWLKQNVPGLYEYYQQEINPRIFVYLQNVKANTYISDINFEPSTPSIELK